MTNADRNDRAFLSPVDGAVRLRLAELGTIEHEPQTTLDGGWWPRTRDLAVELPLLSGAFAELGIRVTRLVYHPSPWLIAPHKLRVAGHTVHLGWFREIDPNLVSLQTSQGGRIELLVVPPEASAEVAQRAMAAAGERGNRTPPTTVLLDAEGIPGATTPATTAAAT